MQRVVGGFLIALVIVGIFNVSNDLSGTFFEATLIDIMSVAVVVLLVFYLTELRSDARNKKEAVDRLIARLINLLDDQVFYNIESEKEVKVIMIKQRDIKNKLEILRNCNLLADEDISYASDQFTAYWECVSEHIRDFDYLKKSSTQLQKHISNMQNRLEKSAISIYK